MDEERRGDEGKGEERRGTEEDKTKRQARKESSHPRLAFNQNRLQQIQHFPKVPGVAVGIEIGHF
jgi:elongation factor P--beta-lysine ligase